MIDAVVLKIKNKQIIGSGKKKYKWVQKSVTDCILCHGNHVNMITRTKHTKKGDKGTIKVVSNFDRHRFFKRELKFHIVILPVDSEVIKVTEWGKKKRLKTGKKISIKERSWKELTQLKKAQGWKKVLVKS